jgi:hypothetical protein
MTIKNTIADRDLEALRAAIAAGTEGRTARPPGEQQDPGRQAGEPPRGRRLRGHGGPAHMPGR